MRPFPARRRPWLSQERPLILITNDDGIRSPGLRAAVEAVADLGEVFVVAPQDQQSGTGRAIVGQRGQTPVEESLLVWGTPMKAYSVAGSPAMAVLYALLVLVPRRPSLAIAGINYGENLGTDVTVSGTVGAALEAADLGSLPWPCRWRQTRPTITPPRQNWTCGPRNISCASSPSAC